LILLLLFVIIDIIIFIDNQVAALPVPLFEALKELATLDCKNNKIQEIKGPIWMLPRLRVIDVHGNNVASPPMAFVDKVKRIILSIIDNSNNNINNTTCRQGKTP
jgi:Leucine-rich repeat (LRR) protein